MDETLARQRLLEVLTVIDGWGQLYDRRWGMRTPYLEDPSVDDRLRAGIDDVRRRTRLARDVVEAMGEADLASRIVEHEEGQFGGHPFTRARTAIMEAAAVLSHREELAEIVGPGGPLLSATQLHRVVWSAASRLWDDGHHRAAVQTAAAALEGLLQVTAGPGAAGTDLASLFSTRPASADAPRLRFRDLDEGSRTWTSAHDGAAALVRGAFQGVRNLVSHPGWPEPTEPEALEMLAVLSYVARLVDRCDTAT